MGVMLESFYVGPGRVKGVPSPLDGNKAIPSWWDHLAAQAQTFAASGFTAIWLPPPLKGASGSFSSGYDPFDDYDLGSKLEKGTVETRYGSRQSLQRCAAMMRANKIDLYIDLVENQRDGDDGQFNFRYQDAFGNPGGGRFAKGPGDFHPNVPQDPGVFDDSSTFGRDLAPINGRPPNHCRDGLLQAADWMTQALDLQGFRLDDMKGVSTNFTTNLLTHGSLADKFAVGEFADGSVPSIENWANAVEHRSAAFDFPLHFALKAMCNSPDTFDMSSLDHAGLAGVDPAGAVTFVENHDTDIGSVGGPVISNKMLAYAYILTSEGYPCVFYRDYSEDTNCFGLKPFLDPLIQIHEQLAEGATQQRWKDPGVFAYERLGGRHLLVGLNKDSNSSRTITVETGFPPNTELQDFTKNARSIKTQFNSQVTLTIPRNNEGRGYVCYAPAAHLETKPRASLSTTQVYEGAADLDIKPAIENQSIEVCSVYAANKTKLEARLTLDPLDWSAATSLRIDIRDSAKTVLISQAFNKTNISQASVSLNVPATGFHTLFVTLKNAPANGKMMPYKMTIRYTAPKTVVTP